MTWILLPRVLFIPSRNLRERLPRRVTGRKPNLGSGSGLPNVGWEGCRSRGQAEGARPAFTVLSRGNVCVLASLRGLRDGGVSLRNSTAIPSPSQAPHPCTQAGHTAASQRTTFQSQFLPPTNLSKRTELRSPDLAADSYTLYPAPAISISSDLVLSFRSKRIRKKTGRTVPATAPAFWRLKAENIF